MLIKKSLNKNYIKDIYLKNISYFSEKHLFLRMQLASGYLKKTHLIRLCKKKIAMLKTILHNKDNINEK